MYFCPGTFLWTSGHFMFTLKTMHDKNINSKYVLVVEEEEGKVTLTKEKGINGMGG